MRSRCVDCRRAQYPELNVSYLARYVRRAPLLGLSLASWAAMRYVSSLSPYMPWCPDHRAAIQIALLFACRAMPAPPCYGGNHAHRIARNSPPLARNALLLAASLTRVSRSSLGASDIRLRGQCSGTVHAHSRSSGCAPVPLVDVQGAVDRVREVRNP